jgi:hypothetical protein
MKDNFVVQGSAVDGVRVADNGGIPRIGRTGVEQSFQLTGRAIEKKGADGAGGVRHGYRVQRRNV